MRTLLFLSVLGLVACGSKAGSGHARWTGPNVDITVEGKALGGWCAESGMVLVEVSEGDRIAGLAWRADPLVADSAPLNLPNDADTVGTHASTAARYIYLDEVRGYRGITGVARITSADTLAFSATVDGRMQRLGEEDTVHFTATFDRVPLTRDLTLCRP